MPDKPDFKIVDFDHIVLRVKDIDRAIGFYTGTLGLEPYRLEQFRAGEVPFPCARVNDHTIIDLLPTPGHQLPDDAPRNLDHFCMVVQNTDMNDFADYLESHGVTVLHDRTGRRSGARGMADSIYIKDPEGNTIELRRY